MEVLDLRAQRLAGPRAHRDAKKTVLEVLVVSVGREKVAFPLEAVDVAIKTPRIARLPNLPATIAGIVPLRGNPVAVVDLSLLLGIDSDSIRAMTVIVECHHKKLGLLVDGVVETRALDPAELSTAAVQSGRVASWPLLATTPDFVCLLDIERLCRDQRVRVAE